MGAFDVGTWRLAGLGSDYDSERGPATPGEGAIARKANGSSPMLRPLT